MRNRKNRSLTPVYVYSLTLLPSLLTVLPDKHDRRFLVSSESLLTFD